MEATTENQTPTAAPVKAEHRAVSISDIFRPHEAIPRTYYSATTLIGLLIIFGMWAIVSYSGVVKPSYFLPTPTQVVQEAVRMAQTGDLWQDTQASLIVILSGWALAALLSVPLGILIGS